MDNAWGFNSLAAWLVYYPCWIGAVLFFWTASLVNLVESVNQGYDEQLAGWRAVGGLSAKPR